jgi:hypothetical protein
VVREVELIPRRGWGGEGALGAVLGFGALHRLPVGIGEEVQAPGENLFDADRKSLDRSYNGTHDRVEDFSQAPIPSPAPPMVNPNLAPPPMMNPNAAPPSNTARAKKTRQHAAPASGFDDMFAEGEKKSKDNDFIASRKGTPLAPPPKGGSAAPSTADEKQDPMQDLGEPGEAEEA